MSRYAISDIHGCAKTFEMMTRSLLGLSPADTLYLLGDYIDRGPDSKGVIDHILRLKEEGVNVICIKGNHEDMLMRSIENPGEHLDHWLRNGGDKTLDSWRNTGRSYADILAGISRDSTYMDFFRSLAYYAETADHYLVHAGFNFLADKPLEDTYSMMWIRGAIADKKFLGNKKIIHGHTPVPLERIQESLSTNMIDIDAGCVYKWREGMGNLAALDVDAMKLVHCPCID